MSKKILCINEGGSNNLGDQAISISLENMVKNYDCDVDSYNFTNINLINNSEININTSDNILYDIEKKVSPIKVFLARFSFIRLLRWIQLHVTKIFLIGKKKYDVAFIGGGQLVLSNTIFPISMLCWALILKYYKTKLIVIGVGTGENYSFIDKFCYKVALNLVDEIYVRDIESINKMKNIFRQKSYFIPDIAFCYDTLNCKQKDLNNRSILIGITEYPVYQHYAKEVSDISLSEDKYIENWHNLIIEISDKFDEFYFVSTTPEDIMYSEKLFSKLRKNNFSKKLIFIDKLLNLDNYVSLIKNVDTVLSARMHSLILAQVFGCTIKPWIVSNKLKSFEKEYLNKNVNDLQKRVEEILSKYLVS